VGERNISSSSAAGAGVGEGGGWSVNVKRVTRQEPNEPASPPVALVASLGRGLLKTHSRLKCSGVKEFKF
jgi:hypothetical protein